MLEVLKEKIDKIDGDVRIKYNYLREYLQLLILRILDEKGYFRQVAFVGGTALRILYDLNRFSEDLGFANIGSEHFFAVKMFQVLEEELSKNNFSLDMKVKDEKTVAFAMIKFVGLLFDLGLSPLKDQRISVKVEIDQNPPSGYKLEYTMINKEFFIGINHYDLPSMFAGKLHALLCRSYIKGRDYYDLMWFLARKIQPNYELLNNAIIQAQSKDCHINKSNLKEFLQEQVKNTDFDKVLADIAPFLADSKEARYFNKEHFLAIIK